MKLVFLLVINVDMDFVFCVNFVYIRMFYFVIFDLNYYFFFCEYYLLYFGCVGICFINVEVGVLRV